MRACIRRDPSSQGGSARLEIESQGQQVVIASNDARAAGIQVTGIERFVDRTPLAINGFTITPFVRDHSAGAYAVLVEADGVALLYASDLQSGAVHDLLTSPPAHVDALLMDSATIGWGVSSDAFPSEGDFEEQFITLFRQTSGLPLVWCSRQNVERIHTIYRACLRTNRQFIVDLSTAEALRAPATQAVGPPVGDRIRAFVSARQLRKMTRKKVPVADLPDGCRIFPDALADAATTSVMLFRPSLMEDLEQAKCLAGARLIFSMWLGYLEYEKANPVLEWLERHGIPLEQCHAAGHAGVMELIRLRQAFGAAPVVPVRSRQPGKFDELFGGVERRADGEWWEITASR